MMKLITMGGLRYIDEGWPSSRVIPLSGETWSALAAARE
jgi:hypothetical protein